MLRRFLRATARQPDRLASLLLLQDSQSFARSNFLLAAARVGLVEALAEPTTKTALVDRLEIRADAQFDLFLQLGVSLRELRVKNDTYALRGRRIKALAGARGEVLQALLEEMIGYHGSVYRHLPERVRDGVQGDYLAATAATVAKSSRVSEPFVAGYLQEVVGAAGRSARVLDAGCGSGVYLRAAAGAADGVTGLGVDLQPDSVGLTRRNLEQWGLGDRFDVVQGDVRDALPGAEQPFDVAFLVNNVYYFTPEERVALFRALRDRLAPGGTLAVVSLFHGSTTTALSLDLVLASTLGCHPLPDVGTVAAELREAGFEVRSPERLMPGQPFFGIRSRAPATQPAAPTVAEAAGA